LGKVWFAFAYANKERDGGACLERERGERVRRENDFVPFICGP